MNVAVRLVTSSLAVAFMAACSGGNQVAADAALADAADPGPDGPEGADAASAIDAEIDAVPGIDAGVNPPMLWVDAVGTSESVLHLISTGPPLRNF